MAVVLASRVHHINHHKYIHITFLRYLHDFIQTDVCPFKSSGWQFFITVPPYKLTTSGKSPYVTDFFFIKVIQVFVVSFHILFVTYFIQSSTDCSLTKNIISISESKSCFTSVVFSIASHEILDALKQ